MPQDFDKCQAEGGHIRRKTLRGGKYINICYDKAGHSHAGNVHMSGGKIATERQGG